MLHDSYFFFRFIYTLKSKYYHKVIRLHIITIPIPVNVTMTMCSACESIIIIIIVKLISISSSIVHFIIRASSIRSESLAIKLNNLYFQG